MGFKKTPYHVSQAGEGRSSSQARINTRQVLGLVASKVALRVQLQFLWRQICPAWIKPAHAVSEAQPLDAARPQKVPQLW